MSFANPMLLALGVAFVALPIVLHFLRRRRPPVMWGAMRFLVEAYRRRRRRMTLEQLLLLLCRCALVLLVAVLIGRPIFGASGGEAGPREVFLVLDTSIASSRSVDGATALDRLKERAAAVLDGLDPAAGDRAALLTLAGPAEGVVYPPSGDIAAVRRLVMRAEPRSSAADLDGAIRLIGEADADAEPAGRSVVLLSELREGSAAMNAPLPPLPASIERLVAAEPSEGESVNVAVAGVRPLRSVLLGAGRVSGQASVSLVRSGAVDLPAASVGVELWATGGGRLGTGAVAFEAGQASASGLVLFELPEAEGSSGVVLEARLTDAADSLRTDNVFRRPVDRKRSIEVGVVARRSLVGQAGLDRFDAADWVRLALSPESGRGDLRVIDVPPTGVDGPRLSTLDAAIVLEPDALAPAAWDDLRAFVDNGGLLMVTPSADEEIQLWTDAFLESMGLGWSIARGVAQVDDAVDTESVEADRGLLGMLAGEFEALAAGVGVSRIAPVDLAEASASVELATESGEPLLVVGSPEGGEGGLSRGLVAYLASAPTPSWTDLPTRPLMVPMLQELIRQGVGRARGSSVAVAGAVPAAGPGLVPLTGGAPVEPPVRDAGVFGLAGPRGGTLGVLAVNPDVEGSRLGASDRVRLRAWLAQAAGGDDRLAWLDDAGAVRSAGGARAEASGEAGRLTLWLAVAAIVLAVIETVLARVASRGEEASRLVGSAA